MFFPQFTLRRLLGITTLFALISLIGANAYRGQPWAVAVMAALVSLVVMAFVHAGFFVVTWVFSLLRSQFEREGADSPFAQHRPAPTVFKVEEVE